MKNYTLLAAAILLFNLSFAQNNSTINLSDIFESYGIENGCFVMFNQNSGQSLYFNKSLCDSAYSPASTFKIPHALIALEERVIIDQNQSLSWNGIEWPVKQWNKNQTLSSAMKFSCVWVFIEFANKLGVDRYQPYLEEFKYGNKNTHGKDNLFWLEGDLKISANQQIDFLKEFYNYRLPVEKRTIDIVKETIVQEKNEQYTISGKTGLGKISPTKNVYWQIGYIEHNNNVYYIALNGTTPLQFNTKEPKRFMLGDILKRTKILD